MDATQIAQENQAFYFSIVPIHICEGAFAHCLCHSVATGIPLHYRIEDLNFSGYIIVDATDINRNCANRGFLDSVNNGILGKVAHMFQQGIVTGELNTDVTIVYDVWKFAFKIAYYERDSAHKHIIADDPLSLPDNERLGRYVKLMITFEE